MAGKLDAELLDAARKEHKSNAHKNTESQSSTDQSSSSGSMNQGGGNNSAGSEQSAGTDQAQSQTQGGNSSNANFDTQIPPPQKDEFEEKFNEYFKGMDSIIAGNVVVEMVDDLKSNLLLIYAKKQGVDIPKEALKMAPKAKEFTAFLVDHAIKNNLFSLIKKYPLVGAVGVVALSAGSTFLMINAMKKQGDEVDQLKKEMAQRDQKEKEMSDLIAKLQAEKIANARASASDAAEVKTE